MLLTSIYTVFLRQLLPILYWQLPPPQILTSSLFCPKAGPSPQAEKPRLQFCRWQVFHLNLRNQRCRFTRDLIGAVVSRCFPHPTLSLASEQTLRDLKRSQGHHEEVRRVELANWALRTSSKFSTGLNISSIRVFDQIRDPEIPY